MTLVDTLLGPSGDPVPDELPRPVVDRPTGSERVFTGLTRAAASTVLAIMGLIGLFLLIRAWPALNKQGTRFLTDEHWRPDVGDFGISAVLLGTFLIALVALFVAIPIAFGSAVYIAEYAPVRLRRALVSLVDLMAAVPSIVYGLWGFFFLQPHAIGLSRWLTDHLGFIPFFKTSRPDFASSTFIAGIVVSLMVIPISCSIMREVFSQAPLAEKEGAYALGCTRWGMIRTVVLPFGRGGVIGGTMLGLGRALGETVAVFLIISPSFERSIHILESGGNSISALIALRYSESSSFGLAALMAAGLVLFVITLIVNALASIIVSRSRSGSATEI